MRLLIATVLGLLLNSNFAYAEPEAENHYQVEIIAFKHLDKEALQSENWPTYPDLPSLDNIIDLQAEDTGQDYFALLSSSNLALNDEENRLNNHESFEVLLHAAWRQPVSNRYEATTVHLEGGRDFDRFANQRFGNALLARELNGSLTISQGKFIDVQANLVLNLPTEEVFNNSFINSVLPSLDGMESFTLVQSRRLRAKEIHYFDHPLFGLLVKITLLELQNASG